MQDCRWGGIVCSRFFVSGACPELLPKGTKTKEKHTVFKPFNLRIYFENFTKWVITIKKRLSFSLKTNNKRFQIICIKTPLN